MYRDRNRGPETVQLRVRVRTCPQSSDVTIDIDPMR